MGNCFGKKVKVLPSFPQCVGMSVSDASRKIRAKFPKITIEIVDLRPGLTYFKFNTKNINENCDDIDVGSGFLLKKYLPEPCYHLITCSNKIENSKGLSYKIILYVVTGSHFNIRHNGVPLLYGIQTVVEEPQVISMNFT